VKILRGTQILYVCVLTSLVAGSANFAVAADINDLLNQKNDLQQQQQELQNAADNKAKEAKTITGQIKGLDSDIQTTQGKIDETGKKVDSISAQITKLSSNIDVKTAELNDLKVKLNNAIREIYRSSSRSELQLLLGTNSLSESMNQMKYTESVEAQVKTIHGQVLSAKNDLQKHKSDQEAKKAELDQLQSQQVAYKKSTEYQKSQQEKLKSMTVEQQQSYEELVAKLRTEMSEISQQIYAERQKRLTGGDESLGGGCSGYPYGEIDVPDAWGFLTRECASYAAWYWNVMLGKKWVNTRPGSGSAANWPALASDQGYSVSSSPKVGAIISWGASSLTSSWGHVAIVESVNSNGTIDLSEYNWLRYSYSRRNNVTPYDYGGYSYIY